MSGNKPRRDLLKKAGSIGFAISGSQGIASAEEEKIKKEVDKVDVESLKRGKARRVVNKVRKKSNYTKLQNFLSSEGLKPVLRDAKVSRVTEGNGVKRDVVAIPFGDKSSSSGRGRSRGKNKGASQSRSDTESFILYTGLDELTTDEIKSLGLGKEGDVSTQSTDGGIPNAFSAYIYENRNTNNVSAQNAQSESIKETSAIVEDGQVLTSVSTVSPTESFMHGEEGGDVAAQQLCQTCFRKKAKCTSWNYGCALYIAGIHISAAGTCYSCYQSGGLSEAFGICTSCFGLLAAVLGGATSDVDYCDLGHDCHMEWECVSEGNEATSCNCHDMKVTCDSVKREV